MTGIEDQLVKVIADGHACVVLGAGVTIASCSTEAAPPTWAGLLESGLRRCVDLGLKDEEWAKRQRVWIDGRAVEELVCVGEIITRTLREHRGGELGLWLSDTLAGLEPTRSRLVSAIERIAAVVVTTNYDLTYEKLTGRGKVSRGEAERLVSMLKGPSRDVLHIHGHVERPDDIVLGTLSYDDVIRDETAQHALKALVMTKTLIFIGFGAGAGDPNFAGLFAFADRVLSKTKHRIYMVGREGERERAVATTPGITYLSCGNDFDDLPGYLHWLADRAGRKGSDGASPHKVVPPCSIAPEPIPDLIPHRRVRVRAEQVDPEVLGTSTGLTWTSAGLVVSICNTQRGPTDEWLFSGELRLYSLTDSSCETVHCDHCSALAATADGLLTAHRELLVRSVDGTPTGRTTAIDGGFVQEIFCSHRGRVAVRLRDGGLDHFAVDVPGRGLVSFETEPTAFFVFPRQFWVTVEPPYGAFAWAGPREVGASFCAVADARSVYVYRSSTRSGVGFHVAGGDRLVTSIAFLDRDSALLVGDSRGRVTVAELDEECKLRRLGYPVANCSVESPVQFLAHLRDTEGVVVISSSGDVVVLDGKTLAPIGRRAGGSGSVMAALDPGGRQIATLSRGERALNVFSFEGVDDVGTSKHDRSAVLDKVALLTYGEAGGAQLGPLLRDFGAEVEQLLGDRLLRKTETGVEPTARGWLRSTLRYEVRQVVLDAYRFLHRLTDGDRWPRSFAWDAFACEYALLPTHRLFATRILAAWSLTRVEGPEFVLPPEDHLLEIRRRFDLHCEHAESWNE